MLKPFAPLDRLAEADLTPDQISAIKGTGRNRMLTKGDVLAALGKISDAKGSMKGIPKTAYATSAGYGDVSRRRAFLFLLARDRSISVPISPSVRVSRIG